MKEKKRKSLSLCNFSKYINKTLNIHWCILYFEISPLKIFYVYQTNAVSNFSIIYFIHINCMTLPLKKKFSQQKVKIIVISVEKKNKHTNFKSADGKFRFFNTILQSDNKHLFLNPTFWNLAIKNHNELYNILIFFVFFLLFFTFLSNEMFHV